MAVLTVSRQFGAGGKTVAEGVAERLGYVIAGEEIIEHLAESAQISPEKLPSFAFEHNYLANPASGSLAPGRFISRILNPEKKFMDGALYVKLLREIIPKIAEKDNTIIIGRGAQFLLKENPNACHVLLVAPEGYRIHFLVDAYDLTMPEAKKILNRQAKRRASLMQLLNVRDYDQPWHYDMVLNMAKLDTDMAIDLVCDLISD